MSALFDIFSNKLQKFNSLGFTKALLNLNFVKNRQIVNVSEASDLLGTLDSNKIYVVDVGDSPIVLPQSIVLPPNGLRLKASDANLPALDVGGAFPMFTGSGQLFAKDIKIQSTANGSSVFDIVGSNPFSAVELTNTNFENCESLGTLTSFRQFYLNNCFIFDCEDGLTFEGVWGGGAAIFSTLAIDFDLANNGNAVFKKGNSLVFNGRFISEANINTNGNSVAYEFEESNFASDQDFQLVGGRLNGNSLTKVNGITVNSTKCLWSSVGIPETAPGGKLTWITQVATPAVQNTAVKLLGTTELTDNIWLTQTVNNKVQIDGTTDLNFRINGSVSLISGNNNQLQLYLKIFDSENNMIDELTYPLITTNGSGRAENVSITDLVTVKGGQYIELWGKNISSNANITVEVNSKIVYEKRKAV